MPVFTTRPVIRARRGVVTSGHYLGTAAGLRIMEQGGNAFDAAAAMGFCLCLLEPERNGLGGEVPTLLYSAADKRAYAVSGQGFSPKALTIDWCREQKIDLIPGDGFLPACVPAMVGTWGLILARFGTRTWAQVLAAAIDLADGGFPMYESMHEGLGRLEPQFAERYPSSHRVFMPGGKVPQVGEVFRNPGFAWTLRQIVQAEQKRGGSRIQGIEAGRDAFYKGKIAERIVEFITGNPVIDASGRKHTGLLTLDDMAAWQASIEEPVRMDYRGLDVCKCPPWTQGPVFLQQLALLDGYDLPAMGHNSADYLHTLMECAKLAFADREAYYGDPAFDQVPLDVLLSGAYAERRRKLIGEQASRELRPGDAGRGAIDYVGFNVVEDHRRAAGGHTGDTTHLDAADAAGNMIAATPSGGWIPSSPVIEGLGFPLGTRGQMFYLNPKRPNALAPHKRPRATLTPTLVLKNGEPFMAFGTEGGDAQDQWTLQFFLNHIVFGMNLQESVDAPTVHSEHFPSSFYPRRGYAARIASEGRIAPSALDDLRRRGHDVQVRGDWGHGKVMCVQRDLRHGTLAAAASPKNIISYALGW
jgi:gamma-glutamyltranspeptidase/glutathione hydrolase